MSDAPGLSPRIASLQLQGHEAELALFRGSLAKGRMPHAWLVSGPPGVGKATFAFTLARILLGGMEADNPVARRISAASHADLLVVERGYDEKKQRYRQEIVADDVRPINAFLRRTAAEGGWRVVIVDGAEWMNRSAANAVLKILEEPPPATVLILTSSAPGRLLPTIRSRCRRLELSPLPDAAMQRVLQLLWSDLPTQDFARIVSQSHGAPGKAVALLADTGGNMAALVAEVLQGVPPLRGYEIAEAVLRKDYGFSLFFALLADQLQSTARHAAKAGNRQCMALAAAWEQIMRVHTETERFNLDKQEALIEAMTIASPE